jgi:hypothetical protein
MKITLVKENGEKFEIETGEKIAVQIPGMHSEIKEFDGTYLSAVQTFIEGGNKISVDFKFDYFTIRNKIPVLEKITLKDK